MPFVEAKCTNCGAFQPVDNAKDAWICNYCQTPFIVEKAIKNYHAQNNNFNKNTGNFFGGKKSDFVIRGGVLEKYKGESRDVVIPDNVVKISDRVFEKLPITSVKIPDSVKELGTYTFYGCKFLKSVNIPNGITYMYYVFTDCESLNSITIPDSVTDMPYAFSGCKSLSSVTIPNSVKNINTAFKDCKSLKSVTISNSVTDMRYAFSGCTSLTSVTIPNSVKIIHCAFRNCTSLKSIIIPDSVSNIAEICYGCTSLTSATIPNSVTDINGAFKGCTSLKSIKIPDSVMNIHSADAFVGCCNLTDIDYPYLKAFADCFPAIAERKRNGLCVYCGRKVSLFGKCKSCGR